ncbi:MAG: hypothetical protein R3310_14490 [Candidatus Competibacteraceae bacterium]|nr:hypothetical protein [Candidatus Competibacteraceae bacterium]
MSDDRQRLEAEARSLGVGAQFAYRYNPVLEHEGWHLVSLDGRRVDEWLARDVDNALEALEARFNRAPHP